MWICKTKLGWNRYPWTFIYGSGMEVLWKSLSTPRYFSLKSVPCLQDGRIGDKLRQYSILQFWMLNIHWWYWWYKNRFLKKTASYKATYKTFSYKDSLLKSLNSDSSKQLKMVEVTNGWKRLWHLGRRKFYFLCCSLVPASSRCLISLMNSCNNFAA